MVIQAMKYRFTVDEYQQMGDAGIFHEDDRVELIEGEIVTMTPIGIRHAGCVLYLNSFFSKKIGEHAMISVQNPVRLDKHSEPQPDITLLKSRTDFYRKGHPQPEDILLIVEVSDSSLPFDRTVKVPLYARHGIVELWIVDLEKRIVEAYWDPSAQGYLSTTTYREHETIAPRLFSDAVLNIQEIMG